MPEKEIIIVAEGCMPYSFHDKDTGRLVEGITVFYLQQGDGQRVFGRIPQKISISDTSLLPFLSSLNFPCELSLINEQRLGKKGVYSKTIGFQLVK